MKQLSSHAMDEVARYFSALAVPMRLRILNLLREGEKNVAEITRCTGGTQANVSKHLAVLAHNGFVERRLNGTRAYFSIADPAIYGLCDAVCDQIGRRYAAQAGLQRMFTGEGRSATRRRRS